MLIVELCQLCIAFNLVYIGLKEARYRVRAYEQMIAALKNLRGISAKSQVYFDLLKDDSEFSKYHHKIAGYLNMLPSKYVNELDVVGIPASTKNKNTHLGWLLSLFNFYKSNWDNYIALGFGIVGPTLIVCAIHIHSLWTDSDISNAMTWAFTAYTSFFLFMPLAFILLGQHMISKIAKYLYEAVDYIVKEYGSLEAASPNDIADIKENGSSKAASPEDVADIKEDGSSKAASPEDVADIKKDGSSKAASPEDVADAITNASRKR